MIEIIQTCPKLSHIMSWRVQKSDLIFAFLAGIIFFTNKYAGNVGVSTNLNWFVNQRSWEKDKQWSACIMAFDDTDGAICDHIL